jgi:hypothetical protein
LSSQRPRYRVFLYIISQRSLSSPQSPWQTMVPSLSPLCTTHPFFSRGTIKDLYAIVGGATIACVGGMLLDEFEELLLPGVISVGKQLFSKRF